MVDAEEVWEVFEEVWRLPFAASYPCGEIDEFEFECCGGGFCCCAGGGDGACDGFREEVVVLQECGDDDGGAVEGYFALVWSGGGAADCLFGES